jgi:hypothetical protein
MTSHPALVLAMSAAIASGIRRHSGISLTLMMVCAIFVTWCGPQANWWDENRLKGVQNQFRLHTQQAWIPV